MNQEADGIHSDAYGSSSGFCGFYEPSVTSSTSLSSQGSVFSETLSAQSSIATSFSDDFRNTQDAREQDRVCAQAQLHFQAQSVGGIQQSDSSVLDRLVKGVSGCTSYADVTSAVPPNRQHPRRCSLTKNQKPPPLVRQRDRKINFVENLVDSATQMVEVLWPLSVVPFKSEASGRGVLPLRTYIEETLRRSRTSYSTLQVALYYLILIRPHVPKHEFATEQPVDCPADRALMCGRRMFLAALILASKYLQDRNYSAKAWSKMSGLRVCEINSNERMFLSKINWRLHIAKPTFERWQEIVLRFTPNPPSSPGATPTTTWKKLVPVLTPELNNISVTEEVDRRIEEQRAIAFDRLSSPSTPTPTKSNMLRPTMQGESMANNSTPPTPMTVLPRFLEPRSDIQPPTPALARMGPLPTPNMTPSSVASNTPAVSVCGSRRPSICSAWALVQKVGINRCALDSYPPNSESSRPLLSRRPSVMSTASSGSSPESLMSDFSRSSRASSISSISTVSTTSSLAPQRACLARQATCRSAGLTSLKLVKEEEREGSAAKPIVIDDDAEMCSSPDAVDFSVSEKVLHAPHRHSRTAKHLATQPHTHSTAEKSRKRGRTSGNRRSELQEEVRYLLQESIDEGGDDNAMDVDERTASPSEAAIYASNLLARGERPCSFSRHVDDGTSALPLGHGCARVSVQRNDGRKRTCCLSRALSMSSPTPL